MQKTITIDREILYDLSGLLAEYQLLLEDGIEQPSKPAQIQKIQKVLAELKKVGNLE